MYINPDEILETIRMIQSEKLDIRTITLSLNLEDCSNSNLDKLQKKIYQKITDYGKNLHNCLELLSRKYGLPIINKRIATSSISTVAASCHIDSYFPVAETMDDAAKKIDIDFIGGFSALIQKGMTVSDKILINSIPEVLSKTKRVCSSVNIASTKAGINGDAALLLAEVIKKTSEATASQNGIGCAKLTVFSNIPEDNPFMAGAYCGVGEPEASVNIGISGPGVIRSAIKRRPKASLDELAETVKQYSFKITRAGELIAREAAKILEVSPGIVDLSLAPSPVIGDSVAEIIEEMGIEKCGAPGSTAALAILIDAVKKGGAMASSSTGGLSGAFIPVSEDIGMAKSVKNGAISLEKLEAMTSVCSLGLDMIPLPGDISVETLASIIIDEMAIGVINNKTTGCRLIPVPGKKTGDEAEFGGLLGKAPILSVSQLSSKNFIQRGGRIPPPLRSLGN